MMDGDLDAILEQMEEAARLALSYVEGMNEQDFLTDTRTQQAVAMNLQIIGEAASRLSRHHADFLALHRDLPWRDMVGMRNRIAHGYFSLDLHIVWETVLTALPELLYRLQSVRDVASARDGSAASRNQITD